MSTYQEHAARDIGRMHDEWEMDSRDDPNVNGFNGNSPDDMSKMIMHEGHPEGEELLYSLGIERELHDIDGNLPTKRQRSPAEEKGVMFVPDSIDPADEYIGTWDYLSKKSRTASRSHALSLQKVEEEADHSFAAPIITGDGSHSKVTADTKQQVLLSKYAGTEHHYSLMIDLVLAQQSQEFAENTSKEALNREDAAIKHARGLEVKNARLKGLLHEAEQELGATNLFLTRIRKLVDD